MKSRSFRNAMALAVAAGTVLTTLTQLPAQQTTTDAPNKKTTKAEKPKSRTESKATVTTVNANAMQVTTAEGNLDIGLTAQTEYWRMEDNLKPADLKVGDLVAFALRTTEGQATVASLAPLTLKFGDTATLTYNKTDKITLDRLTTIKASDIAAGQNVAVAMNVMPDGKLEARKVTVVIAKTKAKAATAPKN